MERQFTFKGSAVHEAVSKLQQASISSEMYGAAINAVVDDHTIKDDGTAGAQLIIEIASELEVAMSK